MRPAAFVGALVGAALGALVWAGIATWTGLEIGWIAWGIGGAVGFGAAMLGGGGATTGMVCAVLALVSIFAGKWIAVDAIAEREVRKLATAFASMDVYQETKQDAEAFAEVTSEAEYPDFMIERGYTQAEYADEVESFELMAFTQGAVPQLQTFRTLNLSYPQWQDHVANEAVRIWDVEISNTELVKENLSAIDVIFGLLGVVTAFQVGARGLGGAGGMQHIPRGDAVRTAGGQGTPYGAPAERYAATALPSSDAPILRDEPPNPYAHPGPSAQPAAPLAPRKIPRLSSQPEPETAGSRQPPA